MAVVYLGSFTVDVDDHAWCSCEDSKVRGMEWGAGQINQCIRITGAANFFLQILTDHQACTTDPQ